MNHYTHLDRAADPHYSQLASFKCKEDSETPSQNKPRGKQNFEKETKKPDF